MNLQGLARLALFALLGLQPLWHVWWVPAQAVPVWTAALIGAAPLLPAALGAILGRPTALFWGALLSLAHFSHGVMEAWAEPAARAPALLQVALSLLLIGAVGLDGWQRRQAARRGSPANL